MASTNGIWFRHYIDAHRNLKLRRLPESTQLFFWWLCELRKSDVYPCSNRDLAWHLRVDEERVAEDLERLRDAGLIMDDDEVKGWGERQFESDGASSTDRVRKHREKKQSDKNDETPRNNDETFRETPPEQSRTETDTDTEREKNARAPEPSDPAIPRSGADHGLPPEAAHLSTSQPATVAQMDHLNTLCEAQGVDPVKALAETSYKTWTKRSAGLVIDRLRKQEADRKSKAGREPPRRARKYRSADDVMDEIDSQRSMEQ